MNNRNIQLDMLKGIAIILMVFDHVHWNNAIHTYIQSFHMPLFFIVSGYLFKPKDILQNVKIRSKKLLIPYLFFGICYTIICYILNKYQIIDFNIASTIKALFLFPTDMNNMPLAPALWFLPCMFITSVVYNTLFKLNKKVRLVLVATISIFGVFYSASNLPMLPFSLEPVCIALLFFEIGNYFKKYNISLKPKVTITIILFILNFVLPFLNTGSVDMRSARYHFFPLYVLCSLIGIVAYYFLVLNINNSKLESFFSWFGKNSMSFLCTNQFVIMVLDILLSLFLQVQLDGILIYIYKIVQFILTMIICATFDIIISKTKLKYVIGK